MPTASDMTGRAALVTGAASGVGRATALALGRAGADLCLVDINAEGLEETAAELRALNLVKGGGKPHVLVSDISVRDNCVAAVAAAVKAFGRLDALCNIAGVLKPAHTTDVAAADWERTLAVNLSAPFFLIQAAIPHLLETQGAVVNVTSVVGLHAQAYNAAYCATKAGLNHMTKSLAMEFMHKPIRINAVAPGGMLTTITRTVQMPPEIDGTLFGRAAPLRGLVEVEDVADMTAFLASDAARGYHGAVIVVDKGLSAG
jgi:NAD(P)-dependent dehydrogenase (short-subunit alcohol dehydrogenase family)